MRCLLIVSAVVLVLACPASGRAYRPPNCGKLAPRRELRCAHRQLTQARRELGAPVVSPPHSRGYWLWRVRVCRRWIRQAHHRLAHPRIAHRRLWVCIHGFEGAWNDDTGNGYYGGLQMTADWSVYGRVLVWHANLLTPYGQMRVAEAGYRIVARAQGWAYARNVWLPGQWYHPTCMKFS